MRKARFLYGLGLLLLPVAACNEQSTPTEVDLTPQFKFTNPSGKTVLDGLDLGGYCVSQGFANAGLKRGVQLGHQAAYNNWVCHDGPPDLYNPTDPTRPINMTKACQWQYSRKAVQAHPTDPDDAFTWVCYASKKG